MLLGTLVVSALAVVPPLSLEALLDEVSRGAPPIRTQQEVVAAAAAGARLAGAWEDPSVMVMAEDVPLPGMAEGDAMRPMLTYRVAQPLNLFGRRELAKTAAAAQVGVERAGLRRMEWDARARAVEGFYELWMNREMGALLDRQLSSLQRMKETATARYAAGLMMGHHEMLRAESEQAAMQAERASLDDERDAAVAMLNALRGRPQGDLLGEPALPTRAPIPDAQALLDSAGERPELLSMELMRSQMEARRELARRMFLPMVMAEGFYQHRPGPEPDSVGAALTLTVPLWWFDRQQHEVDMAEAMVRRSERDLEGMRSMTAADVRAAYSRARAADRTLEALEAIALPRMRETVESSLAAYVSGSGDFLAILEANMSLRALEAQRLQAVMRRELSRFELSRLLAAPLPAPRSP